MLNAVVLPCMVLAALGFVASFIAHVASVVGVELPVGKAVFVLHLGIFVVWLPTVIVMSRFQGRVPNKDLWKVALAGCPKWMKIAVPVIFGYAFLNFFLHLATVTGDPTPTGPNQVRAFSGHWMIFYSAAFATMYSVHMRPDLLTGRKCSSQHAVSFGAEYCEACGERLHDRASST